MKKEEQIREAIKRVINNLVDEEFDSVMKDVKAGKATLTDKSLDDILAELISPRENGSIPE